MSQNQFKFRMWIAFVMLVLFCTSCAIVMAEGQIPSDPKKQTSIGKYITAKEAYEQWKAAPDKTIYAVSRFSDQEAKGRIEEAGVETITLDLLDESLYGRLPEVPNVFYLAGMKFGATGKQPLTWAMNVFLPGLVAQHYKGARIVALSTGNVYPFTAPDRGGSLYPNTLAEKLHPTEGKTT